MLYKMKCPIIIIIIFKYMLKWWKAGWLSYSKSESAYLPACFQEGLSKMKERWLGFNGLA